jgi:short-subunit dehydrogenase
MGRDVMERLLAINLLAPLRLTQALLPHLLTRPEAHIVNVSSMYGFVATRNCAAYHASKFGLFGFSESLYVELRKTRVGVTTVCPGFVATQLFQNGTGGQPGVGVPRPPGWATTTPEHVARSIVRGIERRKRLVIVTPLAWTLYYANRYAPWLLPLLGSRLY